MANLHITTTKLHVTIACGIVFVNSLDEAFAIDGANGSRWMAQDADASSWLMVDLGVLTFIRESELYFVRPTAGHAYILEGSVDGTNWEPCGGHADVQ